MSGGDKSSWYFVAVFLFTLILILTLIPLIFNLSSALFIVEFLILVLYLLVSITLLSGFYLCKKWVWPAFLVLLSASLLNMFVLYLMLGFSKIIVPSFISCLGLVLSLIKSSSKEETSANICTIPSKEIDMPYKPKDPETSLKAEASKKPAKKRGKKKSVKKRTSKKR